MTHLARLAASVEFCLHFVDCIRRTQAHVNEHKTTWYDEQNWQVSADSCSRRFSIGLLNDSFAEVTIGKHACSARIMTE